MIMFISWDSVIWVVLLMKRKSITWVTIALDLDTAVMSMKRGAGKDLSVK